MASARVEVSSFLIQAESVREEIKTKFFRSRQILEVKESDLLSELDQLVASYKGVGVNEQIQELNRMKASLESNVEHNENQETVVKSVALMDSRISELKTSLETTVARMRSVELRWNGELEKKLNQIGWIWVEYEERFQDQTTCRLEYTDLSLSDEHTDLREVSREEGQNINYLSNSGDDFSAGESAVTLKATMDKPNNSQETLTVPSKKENYKRVAKKYKEQRKIARSELEEMTKQFDQYKMKYDDKENIFSQLLIRLKQLEKELDNLKRSQRLSHFSHQFKLDDGKLSIDSNQSDMSIQEEIDHFPVDVTSKPPKSGINKNKLEYLPAPDSLSIRNLSEIANVPSDIKGNELERYSPNVLKQYINSTSTLIYKKSSIKTINLSFLKNPNDHKDKQVFVKVKEIYRLGFLKVIFSKKLPYLSKTEIIAGIRLQEPYGNSNGVHDSVKHFNCPPKHAVFIPINEVFVPLF